MILRRRRLTAMVSALWRTPSRLSGIALAAREHARLDAALHQGLARGEFEVYYQPIVAMPGGTAMGVEALLRWNHAQRGLLLPAAFLSRAEASGLIVPLGHWVLETACRQVMDLQLACPQYPGLWVSVNLSGKQLARPTFVDEVRDVLDRLGFAATDLVLEVRENPILTADEFSIAQLKQLREIGVRIALDDFGAGNSSLANLQRMPIDMIKVDRSFLLGPADQVDPGDLLQAIIAMGQRLDLEVVVEGLESRELVNLLQQNVGVLGQGFEFARPMAADSLVQLLKATGGELSAALLTA